MIRMVVNHAPRHPVFMDLAPSIADDYDISVGTLLGSVANLKKILAKFTEGGLAQRVETRRWYTLYDAAKKLSKEWHTLLCALILSFMVAGIDPWGVAARAKAGKAADDFDSEHKEFVFKHEVLSVLMCQFRRKMCKSMIVVFANIRAHHGRFIEKHTQPGWALRFNLLWADNKDTCFLSSCSCWLCLYCCSKLCVLSAVL